MVIRKVLNNNAVISFDSEGKEVVVLGKGIAFKKTVGDPIDDGIVSGIYSLKEKQNDLIQLAEEIPYEYFDISQRIVSNARKQLNCNLKDNLALALADHIHFAIEKYRKGIITPNLMLTEIRQFYHNEYEVARKSVDEINERFNSALDENEVGFIAFHIVCTEDKMQAVDANEMMEDMRRIISTIEKYYGITLDRDNYDFSRFVVHLKFFLIKVLSGTKGNNASLAEDSLFLMLTERYTSIVECLKRIDALLMLYHNYQLTDSDKMYLIIHLARIIK